MTTLKKSIVASEGTRQHAKGSVAGDSPPKVQWWATVRRRFSGGRQSAEGSVAGDSPPKVQWRATVRRRFSGGAISQLNGFVAAQLAARSVKSVIPEMFCPAAKNHPSLDG